MIFPGGRDSPRPTQREQSKLHPRICNTNRSTAGRTGSRRSNARIESVALLRILLPNYDEFFVGLKDRTAFGTRLASMGVRPRTSALSGHALTVDGQIVGGWTRTMARGKVVIRPTPQIRLSEAERRAVGAAAQRFARFLDLPAEVSWSRAGFVEFSDRSLFHGLAE